MMKLRSIMWLLGLLFSVAACSDDFLTTEPTDRILRNAFWKTQNDFVLAVNATYRNAIAQDQMYIDGATDIAYSQQYWMRQAILARGTHDALYGWTRGLWQGLYQGIAKANEILAQLENTTVLTPAAAAEIEGQARFLRAQYYHELLWMFGEVPLLTRIPTEEEARAATRAPRDQVLALILADLTAAAEKLPNTWAASQRGRATKGAALAYKARAALYEASYQKYAANNVARANELFRTAADAAQAVVNLGVYQLYPNFRNLFTNAGEGNSEVIYDYQVVAGQNGWRAWRGFAPASMGGEVDLTPTRALVDKFQMKDGLPIDQSPLYNPDPVGMYENRDPRLYATVLYPMASFNATTYNSFPNSTTSDKLDRGNFYNTHTGYMGLKYVDPSDRGAPTNSGLNFIKMRYADVLLMLAESSIELGELATAIGPMNLVRTRAGMPAIVLGSQADMIALVRNERVVELAWEGLRLADIRRWRIAHLVMPGRVQGIDYLEGGLKVTAISDDLRVFNPARDYLFPIPSTERDLNPGLTQNPGY
jgi:starch-binding outer membrane protein, SusD/RagB family